MLTWDDLNPVIEIEESQAESDAITIAGVARPMSDSAGFLDQRLPKKAKMMNRMEEKPDRRRNLWKELKKETGGTVSETDDDMPALVWSDDDMPTIREATKMQQATQSITRSSPEFPVARTSTAVADNSGDPVAAELSAIAAVLATELPEFPVARTSTAVADNSGDPAAAELSAIEAVLATEFPFEGCWWQDDDCGTQLMFDNEETFDN